MTGDWLDQPATQAIFDLYETSGWQLYFVGGCVRNAVLHRPVSDIDMSSDAPPESAQAFLTKAGLKVIPTGIEHGTITVLSGGIAHEITTFRKDVETDGRRAVVAFSSRLEDDAHRRDFTINALYADRNGRITDPTGGLADLDPPIIRFIGDADERIREDYLRSLRFFRFHAHFAALDAGFDPDALAAISANLDGLAGLSRERVGAEFLKLLAAPNPAPAVAGMAQSGVLAQLLPGAETGALGLFVHCEDILGIRPNPIARLACLVPLEDAETLRLSRARLRDLDKWRSAAQSSKGPAEIGYRLGHDAGMIALALRAAFLEQPPTAQDLRDLTIGANADFPISAADLRPTFEGPELGEKLRTLESEWIASGFAKSREELLG